MPKYTNVKVDMSGLQKLAREAAKARNSRVKVGVLSTAGTHATSGINLAELAAVHEFGSPGKGIPQRSFIRAPLTNSLVITTLIAKLGKGILLGRFTHKQALEILGTKAATHLKNYTKLGGSPHKSLKAATIARKGSSRPLVDTGPLINSINYVVIS